MKSIAFITEHASPLATLGGVDSGGQNVYVAETALHLAQLGYQVDIFTRCDDEQLPEIVQWQAQIRVIHVEAGPKRFVRKEELLDLMDEFAGWMAHFIEANDMHYELVHAHFFMSGLVAAQLKQRFGFPFVITFHALGKVRMQHQGTADGFPSSRLAIEERLVQAADGVIAECRQDKADLIAYYRARPKKITVIPCGCNLTQFYPVDRPLACHLLGLDPRKKYILHLGRMVSRKGVETVIRGFAAYTRAHPTLAATTELLVVGGESEQPDPALTPEIGRLAQIATAEGIREQVRFVGQRAGDLLKYFYSVAEVFITLPWYEPFGMTPLEAMACGTPVIGAAVGGIKDSVKHEVTGLLVPPKDVEACAQALAAVLNQPAARRRFQENALPRVQEHFTWEKVAIQLDALYQRVTKLRAVPVHGAATAEETVEQVFDEAVIVFQRSCRQLQPAILRAATLIQQCLTKGGKILICGNGGSAADSQHWATEFVGRFQIANRPAYPALALCADASLITAWSNDFSFDSVFARQVEGLGNRQDILICISTSGNSRNLVAATLVAKKKGLLTIGLLGKDGGEVARRVDVAIIVPSQSPARIQEVHLTVLHTITELVENYLSSNEQLHGGPTRDEEDRMLEPVYNGAAPRLGAKHSTLHSRKQVNR